MSEGSKYLRVTHAHKGPIWNHLEPSDVTYSTNKFLGWDFFLTFLTVRQLQTKDQAAPKTVDDTP